jgi:hypothetical protein
MAGKSTNKTILTLLIGASVIFLVWKLWPALSRRTAGAPAGGGSASGGGGNYGGYSDPYSQQPPNQTDPLLQLVSALIKSLSKKGSSGGGGSKGGGGNPSARIGGSPGGFWSAVNKSASDLTSYFNGAGDPNAALDASAYGLDNYQIPDESLYTVQDLPTQDLGTGWNTDPNGIYGAEDAGYGYDGTDAGSYSSGDTGSSGNDSGIVPYDYNPGDGGGDGFGDGGDGGF